MTQASSFWCFWYLLCHPLPQNCCLSSRTYRHQGLKSSLSLAASSWDLRARVEDSMGLYGVLYGLYGVLPKCGNIYELLRDIFLQWVGAYPHFSMRKLTPKEIKSFAQYHRAIWWQCHITWRRQWHPTPVLLPGKSHGRRSLLGYSPWVH